MVLKVSTVDLTILPNGINPAENAVTSDPASPRVMASAMGDRQVFPMQMYRIESGAIGSHCRRNKV
jgi:hypothetical protein